MWVCMEYVYGCNWISYLVFRTCAFVSINRDEGIIMGEGYLFVGAGP